MKIYIPFNSNDFNSVFTTLSISPSRFYPNRKFSFKRSTGTILCNNEDFLIGYEKPTFHNHDFDRDYGYPVLIEIDIKEKTWETTNNGLRYVIIDDTIYLLSKFKLLFRTEKELNETIAKSFKSIETKYVDLAVQNSEIIRVENCLYQLMDINYPSINNNFNSKTFYKERQLNKLFGIVLGSSIAYTSFISNEWQEITILFRKLNNYLSLFINKIGDKNEFEKGQILDIIDRIQKVHKTIEKLEESIILSSNSIFTSDFLNSLKSSTIFSISTFDLLIEGLLVQPNVNLPLSLKLEKLKRSINSKFNSKYPNNFIERINNPFLDVKNRIEEDLNNSRKSHTLSHNHLVTPILIKNKFDFSIPDGLSEKEKEFLIQSLYFFIESDNIPDLETFFINRNSILIELAKHFKETIENFDGSHEREYLINLLKSFDSLRGGFALSNTTNEVLKSLAILFTSGRDLLKFIENNEKEEIQNPFIYYTLWGSIYGAAIFPKTLTKNITENNLSSQLLITNLFELKTNFYDFEPGDYSTNDNHFDTKETEKTSPQNNIASVGHIENKNYYEISSIGKIIIEHIEIKNKIKLADLMKLSRSFKKQSDIENLINQELSHKIKIIKEGRIVYAEKIPLNQLFN